MLPAIFAIKACGPTVGTLFEVAMLLLKNIRPTRKYFHLSLSRCSVSHDDRMSLNINTFGRYCKQFTAVNYSPRMIR